MSRPRARAVRPIGAEPVPPPPDPGPGLDPVWRSGVVFLIAWLSTMIWCRVDEMADERDRMFRGQIHELRRIEEQMDRQNRHLKEIRVVLDERAEHLKDRQEVILDILYERRIDSDAALERARRRARRR